MEGKPNHHPSCHESPRHQGVGSCCTQVTRAQLLDDAFICRSVDGFLGQFHHDLTSRPSPGNHYSYVEIIPELMAELFR